MPGRVLQNWGKALRPVGPIWPKLYIRWRRLVGGDESSQLVGIETQLNAARQRVLGAVIHLHVGNVSQMFTPWHQ